VNDSAAAKKSKTDGTSQVIVQKFLIASPTKFDPATLPILPNIIDIDTAIALRMNWK
jgi:hypothetical protein